jgi:hypothetical protein
VPISEKNLILDLGTPPSEIAALGTYAVNLSDGANIVFDPSAGNLCDDVLYDRRVDNFNFDQLYRARNGGSDYYFRFGCQDCSTSTSKFRYVKWANNVVAPPGTYQFSVVSRDRGQNGTKTLVTIGDSIIWWAEGEAFRVLLAQRRNDFRYIGSRTDIYGFGHEGEGGNGSAQVLARISYILSLIHI